MNRNLTAFILIVIAIGIYVTMTQGIIAAGQAVKAVNDQYSSAIGNATRIVAERDQALQSYNAISDSDKARLNKMIPSTVDNIRLMIDLNGIAARHGLSLSGVQAGVPTAAAQSAAAVQPPGSTMGGLPPSAPALGTVSVSFGVTATYEQFQSFLQDLEADLRIMDLTHLSVTANDTGIYTYSLTFQTYWVKQ